MLPLMTLFEMTSVGISLLIPITMIITVSMKTKVSIAKLEVQITNIKHELIQLEASKLITEKNNRDDHKLITEKLDQIILHYVKK